MKEVEPTPAAAAYSVASVTELTAIVNAKHADGSQATRQGLAHFRDAGQVLLTIKTKVTSGTFSDHVRKHMNCSLREAQRYMWLARNWAKVRDAPTLRHALEMVVDDSDDDAADRDDEPLLCERCQRVGMTVNCAACLRVRAEAEEKAKKKKQKKRLQRRKEQQLEIGFDPAERVQELVERCREDSKALARWVNELLQGPAASELRSIAETYRLPVRTVEVERMETINSLPRLVPEDRWEAVENLRVIFEQLAERILRQSP